MDESAQLNVTVRGFAEFEGVQNLKNMLNISVELVLIIAG